MIIVNKNGLFLNTIYRFKKTFSSLKHSDYKYFWFGQIISWVGTWMQRTAQVWLVYMLTDSPFALGLQGVFQFVPMLLLSLFAGVIVDRFSKKRLIAYTQIGFMLQSIVLAFLVWTGYIEYWHVLLLTAIFGSLQAFDKPARQAWFIDLVGKKDLANAISLNSTVTQMSRFVGPMVAGIVIAKYDIAFCFLVKSISTLAVFISLYFIKAKGEPKIDTKNNIIVEAAGGLKHITKNIELRTTLLMMMIFFAFATNTPVIIPVFTDTVMHLDIEGYTMLLSATGIGALIGAVYMANRTKKMNNKQVIVYAVIVGFLHIGAALTESFPISFIFMFMVGVFSITFSNTANAILQMNASDSYRGRVMSIYVFINQGFQPFGNAFAGTVMEYFGGAMGFMGCGIMLLCLTGLLIMLTPMRGCFFKGKSSTKNMRI